MMRILNVATLLLIAALLGGCCSLCGGGTETVMLINCGALNDYTAPDGRVWSADQMYTGGNLIERFKQNVEGTNADAVYLNERYGLSDYRILLPNGKYTVKLHFAETFEELYSEGERIFTVNIEGLPVLVDFDPLTEAGNKFTAVIKTARVEVTDGELNISFDAKYQSPMINGIEILK